MWLFEVSGCRLGDRAGSLELDTWSFRSLSPESLSAFLVKINFCLSVCLSSQVLYRQFIIKTIVTSYGTYHWGDVLASPPGQIFFLCWGRRQLLLEGDMSLPPPYFAYWETRFSTQRIKVASILIWSRIR